MEPRVKFFRLIVRCIVRREHRHRPVRCRRHTEYIIVLREDLHIVNPGDRNHLPVYAAISGDQLPSRLVQNDQPSVRQHRNIVGAGSVFRDIHRRLHVAPHGGRLIVRVFLARPCLSTTHITFCSRLIRRRRPRPVRGSCRTAAPAASERPRCDSKHHADRQQTFHTATFLYLISVSIPISFHISQSPYLSFPLTAMSKLDATQIRFSRYSMLIITMLSARKLPSVCHFPLIVTASPSSKSAKLPSLDETSSGFMPLFFTVSYW